MADQREPGPESKARPSARLRSGTGRIPNNGRAASLILFGLLLAAPSADAKGQVPAHLDIQSAVIREEPPFDPASLPSRTIVVELLLAGPPSCSATTSFLAYGILIDADRDPLTGLSDPVLSDLGIDARISVDCDGGSGTFFSNAGIAGVTTNADGSATIAISLTVAELPAVEFDWLAFAQEGDTLTRLPDAPEYATWAILERRIP